MANAIVVDFDIDKKNMLRDVITKQTGDMNKAAKELFQNAFDAKSNKIDVELDMKSLVFTDNGCGMNKEQIHRYFRVFGATRKRGDSEKAGVFGIGRGQVFNFGITTWETQNYKMVIDIKKSLSYTIEETNNFIDGTIITIKFYKKLYSWDVSNTIYQMKRDVLPPKGIVIALNKELYEPEITTFKDFSNDKYFVFESKWHRSNIYNKGLAVKHIKDSNYKYSIMPYAKLELNTARNELLETKQSTKDLNYYIDNIEELMASLKNRFNLDEALNVLRLLASKRISLLSVYDKKIVPLSNEKLVSFKEIIQNKNKGIVFGKKNIWSDDCQRQGYQVISNSVYGKITRIKQNFHLDELVFLAKDVKELSRRGFHKEIELSNLKKNEQYYYMAIELNSYIFDNYLDKGKRHIGLGVSDIADAWTDGKSYIRLSRIMIEGFKNKEEAIVRLWEVLCHEYSHKTENMEEDYHNYEFYSEFEEIVTRTVIPLSMCIRYITRKFLKEKYEF